MLVNREGFVEDGSIQDLSSIVRRAVDVLTRLRARYSLAKREQRRRQRIAPEDTAIGPALGKSLDRALELTREARSHVVEGNPAAAASALQNADREITAISRLSRELICMPAESRLCRTGCGSSSRGTIVTLRQSLSADYSSWME